MPATQRSGLAVALAVLSLGLDAAAQEGRILYEQKCGRCHAAHPPNAFSASEWPGIVRDMRSRAALSEEDTRAILDYVLAETGSSSAAEEEPGGPELGGYLYTEYFADTNERSGFDIHYLAISVSGWANDRIQYLGEFELEHGGAGGKNTFVEQAYLDYWLDPKVGIRIGAMLTPFNRFDDVHDPLANRAVTRPLMAREIGVSAWKDVGVSLHGFLPLSAVASLLYDVYAINGLGSGPNLRGSRQYRDNNETMSLGGRFGVVVRDRVELGASVYGGPWDDAGQLDLRMFGSHLLVRAPWLDVHGEVALATSENPAPFADGNMSGAFLQLSRALSPALRATVRFGTLDYQDEGGAFGRERAAGDKALREISIAGAYYPTSRVVFKIEYTRFRDAERDQPSDVNQIGLQAAIAF